MSAFVRLSTMGRKAAFDDLGSELDAAVVKEAGAGFESRGALPTAVWRPTRQHLRARRRDHCQSALAGCRRNCCTPGVSHLHRNERQPPVVDMWIT